MTTGHRRFGWVGLALAIMSCTAVMWGADPVSDPAPTQGSDIDQLKATMAAQQKQIEELRTALEAQKKLIEKLTPGQNGGPAPAQNNNDNAKFSLPNAAKLGEVATTSPVIPPAPLPGPQASSNAVEQSPLSFKIGVADFTPLGFMDFTSIWRSTNSGGIGRPLPRAI